VLDLLPHSCFNMLPVTAWILPAKIIGSAIGYAAVIWAIALTWRLPTRWPSTAAAVAAFLPDTLSYLHPISEWFALLPGSSWLLWVHRTFHRDVSQTHPALGFATQVFLIAAALLVLADRLRFG
jgi:hypothetical protein